MTKQEKEKLLKDFQCDYNRSLEENFAQTFSENDEVRLFFINENQAFTDGRNIIVDPASDDLYVDIKALRTTEQYLKWDACVSVDAWVALRMITRAQTLHECLHLLYSNFPPEAGKDLKCNTENKKKAMALIANIIEDSYIEAVGSSVYGNIESYLKFGRVSRLFLTHESEGTADRVFNRKKTESHLSEKSDVVASGVAIREYLDYMATMLLYPMVKQAEPKEVIRFYVEKTKQLFWDGSKAASPDSRYYYAQQIFDIILPIIPEDEDVSLQIESELLSGAKTHLADASSMGQVERKGKSQEVTTRLFVDLDGNIKEMNDDNVVLKTVLREWQGQKEEAYYIISYTGHEEVYKGSKYDCSVIHKDIKINQIHPKVNMNLKKAYQNIKSYYQVNINSYNDRFAQLLKARVPGREEGFLFGSGIASKQLGDMKKRYWYRNTLGVELPELAIMLLIDGSGSMSGARRNAALQSSVILHEVLKKQGIVHAIVEHRAHFEEPEIDANILVDFNARDEQKYNLMQITANGDNRDALALFWAERYMNQNVHCENKLIIVLSDGYPAHTYDEYYPPVSSQDTANAVTKIVNRGTNIIAVALNDDDAFDCYDALKNIYPNLIACDDLGRLTGQLLSVISKQLS
ncbi:MAG: hypothetical protein IKW28_11830 [Lachnospiraceae bacterium]|nr:hypothetical protein [Lachnospiraceae bacterium]